MHFPHRHRIGINRRELLQVGYSGLLGLGLSSVACAKGQPSRKSPKSVIIVFLTGAASHHETWDPKPDAPTEIRGEYATIPTKTPGLLACEHLPKLAARSDKFAVVPEVGFNVGYQVTPHLKFFVGYSMLYWSRVLRAGDQVDPMIDVLARHAVAGCAHRYPSLTLDRYPSLTLIDILRSR